MLLPAFYRVRKFPNFTLMKMETACLSSSLPTLIWCVDNVVIWWSPCTFFFFSGRLRSFGWNWLHQNESQSFTINTSLFLGISFLTLVWIPVVENHCWHKEFLLLRDEDEAAGMKSLSRETEARFRAEATFFMNSLIPETGKQTITMQSSPQWVGHLSSKSPASETGSEDAGLGVTALIPNRLTTSYGGEK